MATSYVICAAGRGSRTKVINDKIPKALLQINGMTLLEYAIGSLPIRAEDQLIIIGQAEDQLSRIAPKLKVATSHLGWLELSSMTAGQLQTAYLAREKIVENNAIAIFNSDSCFRSALLLEKMQDSKWQGIVPCSIEPGDSWSFCKVRDSIAGAQCLEKIAEKRRISKWCSVGFYYFREPELFFKLAEEELQRDLSTGVGMGEFYVSSLYNRYLNSGHEILMLPVEEFKAMGSPEQFRQYWGLSIEQLKLQNSIWEMA